MRFAYKKVVISGVITSFLGACGGDIPFKSELAVVAPVAHPAHIALEARKHELTRAQKLAIHRFNVAYFWFKWREMLRRNVPSAYSDATWYRVGICETSLNGTMNVHAHGSHYSSPFGILNGSPTGSGGVWDMADDAASAQRIIAGTATYEESLRMAKREANRYGITAWAYHTLVCAGIVS